MKIQQSLIEVMKEVGAVGKHDRNTTQGFAFRGIDAVINAVSPAFQKHGVIVVPSVIDYDYSTVEIGRNRTAMGHVKLKVSYTFIGSEGDSIVTTVASEAMDSGDKATAKAMSVALRTALLQSLALPTDEPDPDSVSYERSSVQEKVAKPEQTKVVATEEQISMAHGALEQVLEIESMEELKNFYAGAQQAGLLYIDVNGVTLNSAISNRKKELEGAK